MGLLRKLFSIGMSKSLPVKAETTTVVGYYNPNTWPVNITISDLNITVPIAPRDYVLDRQGRKVNDPILERYVGPKMLAREQSDKPTALLRISANPSPAPSASSHPVGQGKKDGNGKWQPTPAAAPGTPGALPPAPSASVSSVRGMSIEDAKRLGFIGAQRLVPEDYGAAETNGTPTSNERVPPIRVSIEAPARMARPGQLPAELLQEVQPGTAPLVHMLNQAAQHQPDAEPDLSRKAAISAVQEQQGEEGVQLFKKEATAVKKASVAKAKSTKPAVVEAEPAPETSPIVSGSPVNLPPPELDDAEAAEEAPVEAKIVPTCHLCGRTFKYPSHLKAHMEKGPHKEFHPVKPAAPATPPLPPKLPPKPPVDV